ncbi:MAG: hypothetical protein E7214_13115 [Clostridium sp.]|nr:hypothetical protein [Clostridium sp.]
MYKACIILINDKVYTGEDEDYTGRDIANYLKENKFDISSYTILPKVKDIFYRFLVKCCDEYRVDLVLVIGGEDISNDTIDEVSEESMIVKMNNLPIRRRKNTAIITLKDDTIINNIDIDILKDVAKRIQNSIEDIV